MNLSEKLLSVYNKSNEAFDQKHADWWSKKLIPALKPTGYDPMMISETSGQLKVYTKMYKSSNVSEIKKALEQLGLKIVEVQPNEASYRGSVIAEMPETYESKNENYMLSIIRSPSGKYIFVGSVPQALAFVKVDGSEVTDDEFKQIKKAQSPAMVMKSLKVKEPSFDTIGDAIKFAEERGIKRNQIEVKMGEENSPYPDVFESTKAEKLTKAHETIKATEDRIKNAEEKLKAAQNKKDQEEIKFWTERVQTYKDHLKADQDHLKNVQSFSESVAKIVAGNDQLKLFALKDGKYAILAKSEVQNADDKNLTIDQAIEKYEYETYNSLADAKQKLYKLSKKNESQKTLAESVLSLYEEIIEPSNSLNIPRDEMPQIDSQDMSDFLHYLKEVGCDFRECELLPTDLMPSQNQLDTDKADKIYNEGNALDNPLIVSQDSYVLDGHHRWLAVQRNQPEQKIKCIMLEPNALESLEIMHNYDNSKKLDIEDNLVESKGIFSDVVGKVHYVLKIKNFDYDALTSNLPSQLEALKKVKQFKESAKSVHINAKNKDTEKAVMQWVSQSKPSEFAVNWYEDQDDDSVEIFYKNSASESLSQKCLESYLTESPDMEKTRDEVENIKSKLRDVQAKIHKEQQMGKSDNVLGALKKQWSMYQDQIKKTWSAYDAKHGTNYSKNF